MRTKLIIFIFLLTISTYCFGQLKFEDLHIDTTITGFHFKTDLSGAKVYTKNGAADLTASNPSAFLIAVADINVKAAKEQLDMMMDMSTGTGFKISELVKKDTALGGNQAFYVSYTETDTSGYRSFVFNACVVKGETIIFFFSGDQDKGIYTDKFRKTFYSLKF
jgi:hypothetical protein